MATNSKTRAKGGVWSLDGRRLTVVCFTLLALGMFACTVKANNWTGAGQWPANQTRDWRIPTNWSPAGPPAANAQNIFNYLGEGKIELNGQQSAGGMVFNDFCYSNIAPGVNPNPPFTCDLTMVLPPAGASSVIIGGEGVRDTYGVDYFTAGPEFSATVNLGLNAPMSIPLGAAAGNGAGSAMLFSGQIVNQNPPSSLTYSGIGAGTSLWITANNSFNGGLGTPVTIASGGAGSGADGYIMHLADAGRMNFTPIVLASTSSYLGLQDNTNQNVFPQIANQYFNWVWSYGGNIFTDRSYQLNDLDTSINALEQIMGGVRDFTGTMNFGSTGRFGRTNNGYSLKVSGSFDWVHGNPMELIHVNNGNLTEERGGSRYVSGANRLQEAHNYVYVDNLVENAAQVVPVIKGGDGVLAIDRVNNGVQGQQQLWLCAPQVNAGVLRLGSPANPHAVPAGVTLATPNAGVGIGWNTTVNQFGAAVPFAITPAGIVPGQSGAVDIDMWNHGAGGGIFIDTNVWFGPLTYLRVGSSMGGDASFDPQPNPPLAPTKHATTSATITPFRGWFVQGNCVYYLGGGGGTLEIDSQLFDYEEGTQLEMGTTGTLLPGRVALNPALINNTYTGRTDICAGTLQLMQQGSVRGSSAVHVWTYDLNVTNALYANPGPHHYPWEGPGNYTWTGPGQLLLDPGRNQIPQDWSLGWYTANGGQPLHIPGGISNLFLDGGVIGWTGNVTIPNVPGTYGTPITSNLNPNVPAVVNVLGLGGEYSAGTMTTTFIITNNAQGGNPVLLYKAGKNSVLDLRQTPGGANGYMGGTIIAGGEIYINDSNQLNAGGQFLNAGPVAILNGGRLHIGVGGNNYNFVTSIMVNTAGTPDLLKNCGSVIDVDANVTATLGTSALHPLPLDFSWAPCTYLEKEGSGTLVYNGQALVANPGQANAWGLKLTAGLVKVNQMPVNSNSDSGPVICNNGNLEVMSVPVGMTMDTDPAYGFRNIVSFKGTSSTVTVDDSAMFRTHGIVPNEIVGTVKFVGSDLDADPTNNVVHLSRNMASGLVAVTPGDYSRGDGAMTFQDVTVYMTTGGQGNQLNVLPKEAGFTLQLNDGVIFNANSQNNVYGEVNFNNLTPSNPVKWVKIDGESANATPNVPPPYYSFNLTPDIWTIYGTGYTTWAGTTEKVGSGTVAIKRSTGTPVALATNTLLKISGGTFEAGGSADPFTDNTLSPGLSLDIANDSFLLISDGAKVVDLLTGTGDTMINGPSGMQLTVTAIAQDRLSIAAGNKLVIKGALSGPLEDLGVLTDVNPVPEPSTWLLLSIAALGLHIIARRRK